MTFYLPLFEFFFEFLILISFGGGGGRPLAPCRLTDLPVFGRIRLLCFSVEGLVLRASVRCPASPTINPKKLVAVFALIPRRTIKIRNGFKRYVLYVLFAK